MRWHLYLSKCLLWTSYTAENFSLSSDWMLDAKMERQQWAQQKTIVRSSWLPWTIADFPRVGLWESELASSSVSSITDNNTHTRGTKLVATLVRPGCLAETGTVPIGGHVPMSTPCQAHCSPPSLSMDELQSRDALELQCCVLHSLFVLMGSGNLSAASVSSSAKGADSLFH